MKITLRERRNKSYTSLYLDYYNKGQRHTETLDIHLINEPKTKEDRSKNKESRELAERIRSLRVLQSQSSEYGLPNNSLANASFINFVESYMQERMESKGNLDNWDAMLKHFKAFLSGKTASFKDISEDLISRFKHYLDKTAHKSNGIKLSDSTKQSYFAKFKAAVKLAYEKGYLSNNPASRVKGFKSKESDIEYLTQEELNKLANTPCRHEVLKRAFLFSCLSGLRWSDISKLTWGQVQYSEEQGNFIRFNQQKTDTKENTPISEQALELLGKRCGPEQRVFIGLKYSSWTNQQLQGWVYDAGIYKRITFHCARHTYATQLISKGIDIYTVSKMLGHKNLKNTEIYAKVMDKSKRKAADSLMIDFQ